MRATIILPVKPFDEAKTRLSSLLTENERADLSRRFFRHVLGIAVSLNARARCTVISRSAEVLDLARQAGAEGILEVGNGLNDAIRQALEAAQPNRALLTLSSDLPLLTPDDVMAMLSQAACDIAIGIDRPGKGTNALFMAQPGLIDPAFGLGSRVTHERVAVAAGLRCTIVQRPGLANDIDTPADLLALASGGPRVFEFESGTISVRRGD